MLGEVTSLKISRSVSGMGTSGISISSLTFSAEGTIFKDKQRAPYVAVSAVNSEGNILQLPQYWVDKRSIRNGVITFTCYDTLAFADSLYFEEDDFDGTTLSALGEIDTMAVLGAVQKKMQKGNPLTVDGGGMAYNCRFDAGALIGQTVSSVLQVIAECACGYWCIDNSNTLKLIRYDGYNCDGYVITDDYTAPDIGETMDIEGIDATLESSRRYSYRQDVGGAGYIISINTNGTLTAKNIDSLGETVCGEDKYTYWNVEKAFVDHVPDLGSKFSYYGDKNLVINNVSAEIDCTGVTCSLAANEVSGGEIGQSMGEITRKLENALQSGEVCNNVLITKYQGIQFVEEEDE